MCPQFRESRENPGSIREHLSYGRCSRRIYSLQNKGGHVTLKFQVKKVKLKETKILI